MAKDREAAPPQPGLDHHGEAVERTGGSMMHAARSSLSEAVLQRKLAARLQRRALSPPAAVQMVRVKFNDLRAGASYFVSVAPDPRTAIRLVSFKKGSYQFEGGLTLRDPTSIFDNPDEAAAAAPQQKSLKRKAEAIQEPAADQVIPEDEAPPPQEQGGSGTIASMVAGAAQSLGVVKDANNLDVNAPKPLALDDSEEEEPREKTQEDKMLSLLFEMDPAEFVKLPPEMVQVYMDEQSYVSCVNMARQLLAMTGVGATFESKLPKPPKRDADEHDPQNQAHLAKLRELLQTTAADVAAQVQAGQPCVYNVVISESIHGFTLFARGGRVELLQSFAGADGYGIAADVKADKTLTPAALVNVFSKLFGPNADEDKAAQWALFGGAVDDGYPYIGLSVSRRTLRSDAELRRVFQERIRANLGTLQTLSRSKRKR